jgi:hypothetical protein
MKTFFSLPWWGILITLILVMVFALFLGKTHISLDDWHLSIKVERPVTAILTGLTMLSRIFDW